MVRLDAAGIVPIPFGGSIARVALSPTVFGEVKRMLHGNAYDIVHLHEPTTPAIGPAVLYHSRAINVGTFHHYRDRDEVHLAYEYTRPLWRYFIRRLHGRIAVSPCRAHLY